MITVPLRLQVSIDAYTLLLELDKNFIGSSDYMGLAFFWSYEYRHTLRNVSNTVRRQIHEELLKAGLKVGGVSAQHELIFKKFANKVRM